MQATTMLATAVILAAIGSSNRAVAAESGAESDAGRKTPTQLVIRNETTKAVQVNVILGQPPTVLPAGCTSWGAQLKAIGDLALYTVGQTPHRVIIKPQAPGVTTGGYFMLPANASVAYRPKLDANGHTPLLSANVFFGTWNGATNQGCQSTQFPNAVNLGEVTLNAPLNGSVGTTCANADDNDISGVNGTNALIRVQSKGASWSYTDYRNKALGLNANINGVFGWGATNCINDAGYPNPSSSPVCQQPRDLPKSLDCPKSGQCTSPNGTQTVPCVASVDANGNPTGKKVCHVISDSTSAAPQGTCNNQRTGGVTGGEVVISFTGFTKT